MVRITEDDIRNAYANNLNFLFVVNSSFNRRPKLSEKYCNIYCFPLMEKFGKRREDFFHDGRNEKNSVMDHLTQLDAYRREGRTIIFFENFGKGRPQLPKKSPCIWKKICKFMKNFKNLNGISTNFEP